VPSPLPPNQQLPLEVLFTPEEIHSHCEPGPFLRQFLESAMAKTIRTRLDLKYDVAQPLAFLQEEAYLKARYDLLHELLNLKLYYPVPEATKTKEK
jgi:hypothetical protein